MFRVVVIEDEDIIRNGLIKMINWPTLVCRIVGEARNGQEGLKIIESTKPDIVLLDINMPLLSGIEMLERLPRGIFATIIITGHSEFEYAKKAIDYDVTDYLLKPIEKANLIESIEKAKTYLKMRRSYKAQIQDKKYQVLDESIKIDSITLNKAIKYIESNIQNKITMKDLVEFTNKSQTSINTRFQRNFDMTFNEYLCRYRIQKAINYIKTLQYQLYEVAEMVGISDYKYFGNVFKKYVNESPSMVELYYLRNNQNK